MLSLLMLGGSTVCDALETSVYFDDDVPVSSNERRAILCVLGAVASIANKRRELDRVNGAGIAYNLQVYSLNGFWELHYSDDKQDTVLATISHSLVLESSLCEWVDSFIPLIYSRIPEKKRRRTNDSQHSEVEDQVVYDFKTAG